ncbi:MAG: PAS domain-containing protein, partial [Myxococcota bacterium]
MRLGFRSKLFLVSLLVIVTTLVGGGAYLEHRLVDRLEGRIESELLRATRSARQAAELLPDNRPVSYQQLATRLSEATEARVTIVAADGTVLGDSDVPEHLVPRMENHADRPEIRAAWQKGHGVSRRFSDTLGKDMQYAAVPFDRHGERAIIRSALPLSEVDRSVAELRMLLVAAGLLALAISALMTLLSTHYMAQTIRGLFSVTRTSGQLAPGTASASGRGDIEHLAGSLGEMAEAFEDNLRALAWERDRFDAVLQSMGDAVVAVDSEMRVTLCNLAAVRMLGWEEAPLGRPLLEVFRQPGVHDLVKATEDADSGARETEVELPDDTHLLVRSARLASVEGGVLLVMRDITKLRRLETVRRDFVANVSHELRTPVTTIRATVDALQGGAMTDA